MSASDLIVSRLSMQSMQQGEHDQIQTGLEHHWVRRALQACISLLAIPDIVFANASASFSVSLSEVGIRILQRQDRKEGSELFLMHLLKGSSVRGRNAWTREDGPSLDQCSFS